MEKNCIWGLDVSMSRTGITIVGNDTNIRNPVFLGSVETNSDDESGRRLKIIADEIIRLKDLFYPKEVAIEAGFYRFNKSTQVIYMVHGVVRYLLHDVSIYSYPPATVKKLAGGKGNMKKDELRQKMIENYGHVGFSNNDESDSFAVLVAHLKEKGIL